jgi:hypothetical protein
MTLRQTWWHPQIQIDVPRMPPLPEQTISNLLEIRLGNNERILELPNPQPAATLQITMVSGWCMKMAPLTNSLIVSDTEQIATVRVTTDATYEPPLWALRNGQGWSSTIMWWVKRTHCFQRALNASWICLSWGVGPPPALCHFSSRTTNGNHNLIRIEQEPALSTFANFWKLW